MSFSSLLSMSPASQQHHVDQQQQLEQQHQQQRQQQLERELAETQRASYSTCSLNLFGGATSSHQIPFTPSPVQHAPTPLTFGFGSLAASTQPTSSASVSWGSSFGPAATTTSSAYRPATSRFAQPQQAPASAGRNEAKRRRSASIDSDDAEMNGAPPSQRGSPRSMAGRVITDGRRQALPKRMRAGLALGTGQMNLDETASSTTSTTSSRAASPSAALPGRLFAKSINSSSSSSSSKRTAPEETLPEGVDLGKMLTTLDKPSLLSLLSRLMAASSDPTLPLQIMRHMPAPCIASALAALDEAERVLRAALPSVTSGGEVRAEWAWGRLRGPTQEFVSTALGFLPWFGGGSGPTSSSLSVNGVTTSQQQRDAMHPSTTFGFLHEVTLRLLRLQALLPPVPDSTFAFAAATSNARDTSASNTSTQRGATTALAALLPAKALSPSSPNTLLSSLAPQLVVRWSALLGRISGAVNDEGRIFGHEMVRGWISQLDGLGTRNGTPHMRVEERALRTCFQNMHDALVDRVGWLVGIQRPRTVLGITPAASHAQQPQPQSVGMMQQHHHQQLQHHHHQQQHQQATHQLSWAAAVLSHQPTQPTGMEEEEEEL